MARFRKNDFFKWTHIIKYLAHFSYIINNLDFVRHLQLSSNKY